MSFRHRDWKQLRKAEVLGFPTEEIADHWLIPVPLKTKRPSPGPRSGPRIKFETSVFRETYKVPPLPNGESRKAKNKNKATGLPPVAKRNILTVHPLPRTLDKRQTRNAHPKRSHFGRLAKKGTKKAALARAESGNGDRKVPFQDALNAIPKESRVAAVESLLEHYFFKGNLDVGQLEDVLRTLQLENDPIMMKGSAFLLKHGFFFSMIKVSYVNDDLHPRLLKDMKLLLEIEDEKQDSGDSWFWHSIDRDLFVKQFQRLPIITHYKHVRRQLLSMEDQGVHALFRIEREMLMKVVEDFLNHLDHGHEPTQTTPPSYPIELDAIPLVHIPGLRALRESVGTQTPPDNLTSNCVQVVLNVHPDPAEESISSLSMCVPDVEETEREDLSEGVARGGEVESRVDASHSVEIGLQPSGEKQLSDQLQPEMQVEMSCTETACRLVPVQPEKDRSVVKDDGVNLDSRDDNILETPRLSTNCDEEQSIASGSKHRSGSDSDDDCLSVLSFRNRGVDPLVDRKGYQQEVDCVDGASSEISLELSCLDDGVSLTIRPRGAPAMASENWSVGEPSMDSNAVSGSCDKISVVLEAKEEGVKVTLVPDINAGGNEGEELKDCSADSGRDTDGPHDISNSETEEKCTNEYLNAKLATSEPAADRAIPVSPPESQFYPSQVHTATEVTEPETCPTTMPHQDEICVELKPLQDGIVLVLSPKTASLKMAADNQAIPLVEEAGDEIISLDNSTLSERVSLKLLPRCTPNPRQEDSDGKDPLSCDGHVRVKLIPVNETVSIALRTETTHEHSSPFIAGESVANELEAVSVQVIVQEDRFLLSLDPRYRPSSKSRNVPSEEKVTVQLSLLEDCVSIELTPTNCAESLDNITQLLGDQCEEVSARLTPDESVAVILTPQRQTAVAKILGKDDSQISERVHLEMAYMMDGVSLELEPQSSQGDLLPPRPSSEQEISVHLAVEEVFSLVLTPQRQRLTAGHRERTLNEVKTNEEAQTLARSSQNATEMTIEEPRTRVDVAERDSDSSTLEETDAASGALKTSDETLLKDVQGSGDKIKEVGKAMIEPGMRTTQTETEATGSVSCDPKETNPVDLEKVQRETPFLEESCTSSTPNLSEESATVKIHQEGEYMKVIVTVTPSGAEDASAEADEWVEATSTYNLDESVKVTLAPDGDSCSLSLAVNNQPNSSEERLSPVGKSVANAGDDSVSVAQLKEEADILEAEIDEERRILHQEKTKLEGHLGILMKVMEEQEEAESRASTPGNLQQLEAERLSLMKEIEQEKERLAAIVETLASSVISPRWDGIPDKLTTQKDRSVERAQETSSSASPSPQEAQSGTTSVPIMENSLSTIPCKRDGNQENQAQRCNSGKDASTSAQNCANEPPSSGRYPDDAKALAQESDSNRNVPDTDQPTAAAEPLPMEESPSQSKGVGDRRSDTADGRQIPEKAVLERAESNHTKKDAASPESAPSSAPNNALEDLTAKIPEESRLTPGIEVAEIGDVGAAKEEDVHGLSTSSIHGEDTSITNSVQAEYCTEEKDQDENQQPASEPGLELDAKKNAHASANIETEDSAKQNGIQESLDAFQEQLAQTQQIAAVLQAYQPTTIESDEHSSRTGSPTKIQVTPEDARKLALLSEELKKSPDFDEPPTKEEVNKFAVYLGMDPEEDKEFLYIAEWALTAPLPAGWTVHLDSQGNEFYFNTVTKVSQYGHPMDGKYKELYQKLKMEKSSGEKDKDT